MGSEGTVLSVLIKPFAESRKYDFTCVDLEPAIIGKSRRMHRR